ncbi:HNH endonuclease [Streptomyces sp. JJ36]|uniref:HNH endonuclease n=1 Tax=Streptomyces sp. JJ36 TaxID=2736645 RepID=UPI001F387FAD|nr:HNH endonuclease [Streptomyces sp. JJ36]MCF6526185.1 HNH endonuclease [Streptomyces sp. JJ36]
MIKLVRSRADENLLVRLNRKTRGLGGSPSVHLVRSQWKNARILRRDILELLENMAPGINRCMYCGDSLGTDIDHFEPLARNPLRAFEWINHLLACSFCNSNKKRDQFPCDDYGHPLLIDPTHEDPYDHIRLVFTTGKYVPLSPKGEATIEVFGLSRMPLERGRASAFVRCKSMLRDFNGQLMRGNASAVVEVRRAMFDQPFADVFLAMLQQAEKPGAAIVFGNDVVEALKAWKVTSAQLG